MKKLCYTVAILLGSTTWLATIGHADSAMQRPLPSQIISVPSAHTLDTLKNKNPSRLWNLQDADILSIINEVSLETGKNFIVDPRVTGKISLVSSKPIKSGEVYNVFLSVLELLGYSAIANGNVVKIVPNMESGEFASRVASNNQPGSGAEVVVRVIPLENISANQLIPVIRPLLPQWSNVSTYSPGNVLILMGHADNLIRISQVIHDIDQSSSSNIDMIPLHQASASQIAGVLTNLQNTSRATGEMPQVSVAADERSNSILLSGNKTARMRMKLLIAQLDTPSASVQGNTQVIYLRYLQAKTFAPLLGKIAKNIAGKKDDSPAANPEPQTKTTGTNKTSNAAPDNQTNIQAEPNTNAIIITAAPTLMHALTTIISQLDIRPAQVLVEGIIVEIDQDDLRNLGIQWGGIAVSNGGGDGGVSPTQATSTADFPPIGAGTIGIIPHTQIQAILSLLENKNGVDILSTPSIVVLDNRKAMLEIGQEVPTQTGSYATTGNSATVTPYNTIGSKPVTMKLQVNPQINLGNSVRLTINLKNDSLQNPSNPGLTPIINTSKIQNSVIIKSEDILVLGGLISNNITESTNKVPFFGDLPIVGKLFQQKARKLEKRNLLVFIKPTILRNAEDTSAITNTKYNYIRDTQINWPEDLSSSAQQKAQSILPLWKNNVALPKPFETIDSAS
jgi:general secretion pathway protein D